MSNGRREEKEKSEKSLSMGALLLRQCLLSNQSMASSLLFARGVGSFAPPPFLFAFNPRSVGAQALSGERKIKGKGAFHGTLSFFHKRERKKRKSDFLLPFYFFSTSSYNFPFPRLNSGTPRPLSR